MRVHARTLTATLRELTLHCPLPGRFRPAMAAGDTVHAGSHVGDLDVLGRVSRVLAPDGAAGAIVTIADGPVEFGAPLATLDPSATPAHATARAGAKQANLGKTFTAPTSGRFYGRSGPGKEAFVAAGTELKPGTTICLLEVMKTFHRVTYHGEPARVREVLVADGADVNAGDPLLALE